MPANPTATTEYELPLGAGPPLPGVGDTFAVLVGSRIVTIDSSTGAVVSSVEVEGQVTGILP